VPAIARIAGERHVVAAGGIVDVASARAALDLGADAVCLGTRFVACAESPAHTGWKQRIVSAGPADTVITRLFGPEWPDAPMRVLRNRAVARTEGRDASPTPLSPIGTTRLDGHAVAMPPASVMLPTEDTEGDLEEMCLAAGTGAAGIDRIETAAEIVAGIASGIAR
jgi:NAD(P)H-dependent flavin oxidoreductase YrpB (nitropropane dioxygenase family)